MYACHRWLVYIWFSAKVAKKGSVVLATSKMGLSDYCIVIYIYIYIYIVCIVCDTLPMFIVHQILFVLVISLNFNLVKVKNRSYSQRIIWIFGWKFRIAIMKFDLNKTTDFLIFWPALIYSIVFFLKKTLVRCYIWMFV